MQRRIIVPLVVISLLAAAAFAAYWGIPRIILSQDPDDVDHVSLYQNGLAAITLNRPFQSTGGDQILVISLPTTTIFDSLTVKGKDVSVKEMRSSLAADPALRPGDHLTVRTDDSSTVTGTFLALEGNQLMLAKESGTVVIRLEHVVSVEVSGRTVGPSGPGSTSVSILVNAPAGEQSVRISYLAQGVGWTPNYILDPKAKEMTFFATLTGLQDWSNVTLDLVAGQPNMVYSPMYGDGRGGAYSLDFAGISSESLYKGTGTYAPSVGGSEPLGAMHRYHYNGKVDLSHGETVRLPLVSGTVDIVRHYYRAEGGAYSQEWRALPETYQIRNTLGETLPAGPVRVFIDGDWIGADNMQAIGKGEETNITVAFSNDIKSRVEQVSQTRSDPSFPDPMPAGYHGSRRGLVTVTTTYDFQARNLGSFDVDLRASFQAHEGGSTTIVSIQPDPDERRNGALVWNDDLEDGETLHYKVTIRTIEESYHEYP